MRIGSDSFGVDAGVISAAALWAGNPESVADKQIERHDDGAYKASTLIDFERGQRLN